MNLSESLHEMGISSASKLLILESLRKRSSVMEQELPRVGFPTSASIIESNIYTDLVQKNIPKTFEKKSLNISTNVSQEDILYKSKPHVSSLNEPEVSLSKAINSTNVEKICSESKMTAEPKNTFPTFKSETEAFLRDHKVKMDNGISPCTSNVIRCDRSDVSNDANSFKEIKSHKAFADYDARESLASNTSTILSSNSGKNIESHIPEITHADNSSSQVSDSSSERTTMDRASTINEGNILKKMESRLEELRMRNQVLPTEGCRSELNLPASQDMNQMSSIPVAPSYPNLSSSTFSFLPSKSKAADSSSKQNNSKQKVRALELAKKAKEENDRKEHQKEEERKMRMMMRDKAMVQRQKAQQNQQQKQNTLRQEHSSKKEIFVKQNVLKPHNQNK